MAMPTALCRAYSLLDNVPKSMTTPQSHQSGSVGSLDSIDMVETQPSTLVDSGRPQS